MPTFVENLHQRDKREHPLSSPIPPHEVLLSPLPSLPQQGGGGRGGWVPELFAKCYTQTGYPEKNPPVKSYPEPRRLDICIYCIYRARNDRVISRSVFPSIRHLSCLTFYTLERMRIEQQNFFLYRSETKKQNSLNISIRVCTYCTVKCAYILMEKPVFFILTNHFWTFFVWNKYWTYSLFYPNLSKKVQIQPDTELDLPHEPKRFFFKDGPGDQEGWMVFRP